MVKIKWKYISLTILVALMVITSLRLKIVNENSQYYETHRINIEAGETVTIGDLEFTFGEASDPIIKKSENYADKKMAIYKLPIKVTKKSDHVKKYKFGIYEKYKDYINLALVSFDSNQKQSLSSTINGLKKGETVHLSISTDFLIGDFYYYYDDYDVDQPAYIVIAGPPSPKGVPLYYYKLQQRL